MDKYTGTKVEVPLVGEDGNAFSIIGRVLRAMDRQLPEKGFNKALINSIKQEYEEKVTSGDYNNLLRITMEYTEEPPHDDEDEDICEECGNLMYECECCPECHQADCECPEWARESRERDCDYNGY